MQSFRRALVLAPHTDDAELGAGGTMARLIEQDTEVYVAAFSTAETSLPADLPPTQLRDEFNAAMASLGVPEARRFVYKYPVRRLGEYRQELLERLIEMRAQVAPDLVLLPSGSDIHQDHRVLYDEGLRAFKNFTVWGYELPWNHITFSAHAFVALDARHLDAKCAALAYYTSQIKLERPYFERTFVEGWARMRGTQIKAEFAEAFEVLRHVVR